MAPELPAAEPVTLEALAEEIRLLRQEVELLRASQPVYIPQPYPAWPAPAPWPWWHGPTLYGPAIALSGGSA